MTPFRIYFWTEWTPQACKPRWWQYRVFQDPERYRTLYVCAGLHIPVAIALWTWHKWHRLKGRKSWLELMIERDVIERYDELRTAAWDRSGPLGLRPHNPPKPR